MPSDTNSSRMLKAVRVGDALRVAPWMFAFVLVGLLEAAPAQASFLVSTEGPSSKASEIGPRKWFVDHDVVIGPAAPPSASPRDIMPGSFLEPEAINSDTTDEANFTPSRGAGPPTSHGSVGGLLGFASATNSYSVVPKPFAHQWLALDTCLIKPAEPVFDFLRPPRASFEAARDAIAD